MPFPTPAYSFDPALIDASLRDGGRPTPHVPLPALEFPPTLLGASRRPRSPFLDAGMPMHGMLMDGDHLQHGDPALDGEEADGLDDTLPVSGMMDGMVYVQMIDPPLRAGMPDTLEAAMRAAALPEAPFDRAAVERARARAARVVERVEATVMTDDGVAEHVCDVSAWLAGASVDELVALMRAGWAGAEAEDVAAELAEEDPEVADVLHHARRTDAELLVDIDGAAAMVWLTRHRPRIAARVDEALGGGSIDDELLDDADADD